MERPWLICREFLKAIEENNCATVNGILDTGFDIDTDLKIQRTAISICASNGWYDMAQLLMARGCSLSLKTDKGETPLHLAVLRSDYKLVKLLIENRADLTSVDRLRRTVLHYACEMGCLKIVNVIVEHSTPSIINMRDSEWKTPLIYACQNGCISMIECLLSKGAEVNVADGYGNSPLIHALSNKYCSPTLINLLLDAGANIDHTNDVNETALLHACSSFSFKSMYKTNPIYYEILLLLIDRGSDVNATNVLCETPLHLAMGLKDKFLICKLINYGSNINALNALCVSPIEYACKEGLHEIVSLLLDAGAKVNVDFTEKSEIFLDGVPIEHLIWERFRPLPYIALLTTKEMPFPLKNLCRICVRKNLPKNKELSAKYLPLPPCLKRFILFND